MPRLRGGYRCTPADIETHSNLVRTCTYDLALIMGASSTTAAAHAASSAAGGGAGWGVRWVGWDEGEFTTGTESRQDKACETPNPCQSTKIGAPSHSLQLAGNTEQGAEWLQNTALRRQARVDGWYLNKSSTHL